jgi:serine/threonine-protein kinase
MSPEQFRNPRRVDGRADIWSLGIVAYRLLSGTFPYAGETSVDVFAAILETKPPTLRELGIDVPPAVGARSLPEQHARKRNRVRDRMNRSSSLSRAACP